MAYTGTTTHYSLPQFAGTDIPTWDDINTAFTAIDTALYNISQASGISQQQAQALIDASLVDTIKYDSTAGTGITNAQYSKLKIITQQS